MYLYKYKLISVDNYVRISHIEYAGKKQQYVLFLVYSTWCSVHATASSSRSMYIIYSMYCTFIPAIQTETITVTPYQREERRTRGLAWTAPTALTELSISGAHQTSSLTYFSLLSTKDPV